MNLSALTIAKRTLWFLLPFALVFVCLEIFLNGGSSIKSSGTYFSTLFMWTTWYFFETIYNHQGKKLANKLNFLLGILFFILLFFVEIFAIKTFYGHGSYKLLLTIPACMIVLLFLFIIVINKNWRN